MAPRGRLVVGVDCSTTACKAILWDARGRAVAEGRAPLALSNPAPDAYEQDAEAWWKATALALRRAMAAAGPRAPSRLDALCITHQRETVVVTDEAGRPLAPALVWMDARCRAQVRRAREVLGEGELHRLSGKVPCTTPSVYKLMGLFERDRSIDAAKARVCEVHAWLAWRMTGRFATSLASADPTGLVDMQRHAWSPAIAKLAGLDPRLLPELVPPGALLGPLAPRAARALGLPAGLPVVAGAGDGQAAALGAGVTEADRAYLNLGTALVCGVPSPTYQIGRAFRTLYTAQPGAYLLETDLKGGTFSLGWFAGNLLGQKGNARTLARLRELEGEARTLSPTSGGLLFVPYLHGVMNPHWDDDASALWFGLRGDHDAAALYRSVLEGLAFEQRLALEGVEAETGRRVDELRIMGGGAKSELFCQIVSDVMQKPLRLTGSAEATCLGAGMLAAVASGWFGDAHEAARAMSSTGRGFEPGPASGVYDGWFRRVYAGLYPAMQHAAAEAAALRGAG
ncbi:MAG: FGGY family carbohydrate kinase [Polyangiaceae bacterium]|nr:FGGY family carbohydrate kinase [Polyangiaceae bacterium]